MLQEAVLQKSHIQANLQTEVEEKTDAYMALGTELGSTAEGQSQWGFLKNVININKFFADTNATPTHSNHNKENIENLTKEKIN